MLSLDQMIFENSGRADLAAGVSSFGLVFSPGEIFDASRVAAQIGGVTTSIQLDAKTRYEDGSIRTAVAAVARPALAVGGSVTIDIGAGANQQAAPINLQQGLAGHSFLIDSTNSAGGTQRIDVVGALRAALADGTASFWQSGPLVSQARIALPGEGSQRFVCDVSLYADGNWAVDVQFANDRAMEAGGSWASRQLNVSMDGKTVFDGSLSQGQYQSYHQRFSSDNHNGGQGLGDPGQGWLNIKHDVEALAQAGAVAHYALGQGVSASLLEGYAAMAGGPDWGAPMSANGVTKYMPQTGGRPDIGFTTAPNTAWLISQDPRAAEVALMQAETASAIPWHAWDQANGSWLSTEYYGKLWTDPRGGAGQPGDPQSGGLTRQPDAQTGWVTDSAHQPDLSYVPFLLTGERWMLDNLQAQSAWAVLSTWPLQRGNDQDLLVRDSQVRSAAWSLRQIDAAAWVSPDNSPEQAYFREVSAANWSWLVSQIPAWTALQGETHGWLPGVYGGNGAIPPWQQDFFASTAIAAARHGSADAATFLDWQANFLIGRFTHAAQGFAMHDGAAYVIAAADPTSGRVFTTWAEMGDATRQSGWSNGDGWAQSEGYYGQVALATLSGLAEVSQNPAIAAAATRAYWALLAEAPRFTSPADFARDPTFSIAAPFTQMAPPPQAGTSVSGGSGDDVLNGLVGPMLMTGGSGADRFAFDLSAGVSTRLATDAITDFSLTDGDDVWITRGGTPVVNLAWAGSMTESFSALDHDIALPGRGTTGGSLPMWWVPSTTQGGWLVVDENGDGVLSGNEFALRITSNVPDPSRISRPLDDSQTLVGTAGPDTLLMSDDTPNARGGAGDDIIRGGAGRGMMEGGAGDDVYVVHNAQASVVEQPGEGYDTAWFDVSGATLAANIEKGILFGVATSLNGSAGNDTLVANALLPSLLRGLGGDDTLWSTPLADTLDGGAGDDILRGGGGADLMLGGAGNDHFVVASVATRVVESTGDGTDTAWVMVNDWTLAANVEIGRLAAADATRLLGSEGSDHLVANQTIGSQLWGRGGDDTLWGSVYADTLNGGDGNDIMRGQGGDDQMTGGAGDDQYVVFSPGARLFEAAGGGYDIVYYVGPGTFMLGDEVEEGRLASEGTGLIGNASNNLLVGSNVGLGGVLDGRGGDDIIFGTPDADIITGGAGQDTMYSYGGADRFVYAGSNWGVDQLSGFTVGSAKLDFRGSGLSWRDLFVVPDGDNTLVVHQGSVIFLYGAQAVTQNDFMF